MSIPTSNRLAASLHEAGLIPDPNRVNKIVITAEAARPVKIEITMWGDDHMIKTLTRELSGISDAAPVEYSTPVSGAVGHSENTSHPGNWQILTP